MWDDVTVLFWRQCGQKEKITAVQDVLRAAIQLGVRSGGLDVAESCYEVTGSVEVAASGKGKEPRVAPAVSCLVASLPARRLACRWPWRRLVPPPLLGLTSATAHLPCRPTDMPPKSILKKTTAASTQNDASGKPVDPRHLKVALHHANLLEERKRVEAQVLDTVMTLMEWPTSPDADPKSPSASDARFFCQALIPFQPADYDALIEERNISDKCGYALCPQPKQKARSTAKKQFIDTDHGVEIVDRSVLEMWCSDDCARRALYVKVQLNEEPAWMRQGGYGDKIELMVDNSEEQHKALPLRLKQEDATPPSADQDADDVAAAWAAREVAMADLALERGEKPGQLTKANQDLIKDEIQEKTSSTLVPEPPSLPKESFENSTMAIEGHIPKGDRKDNEDDEDDVQDWDKHLP